MNKIIGKDLIVDINKVKPNTWNPKESIEESTENKKHYEEIKREIEKKGLFEAITVRELKNEYEILDGYHRWTACKELGFTEIRVNNLGEISDPLAMAITSIKEQKKVPISEIKQAEVVQKVLELMGNDKEKTKDLLGYEDDILEEYINLFEFNFDNLDGEFTEGEDKEKGEEVECPECGHKFVV